MGENLKLLILEPEEQLRDQRLGLRTGRIKALNAISASGAKIRHDSGGRLVVIEVPEDMTEKLTASLSGAHLVDFNTKDVIPNLDATEALFLDALRMRSSKRYREARARSIPGETPEEKEFFSAPHTREDF